LDISVFKHLFLRVFNETETDKYDKKSFSLLILLMTSRESSEKMKEGREEGKEKGREGR
jgi:hypothetical protein